MNGVIAFFAAVLIYVCSTLAMIYGWGVEPKSWLIIIFVGYVPTSLIAGFSGMLKE